MTRILWAAALLVACAGDKDTPTDDTGDTDTTPACGNSLIASWPLDGDSAVYWRSAVDATLAAPDDTATIVVTDGSGAEVPGSVATIADRVLFTADAPYAPGETYTSTLQWGCPEVTATWTVDTAVGDAFDLTAVSGSTYVLDLRTGRFVAPTGIGDALQSLLQVNLLLQVVDNGGAMELVAGVADDANGQDTCVPTVPFDQPAESGENPYFTAAQPTLPLTVAGDAVTVSDLDVSGTLTPDGSAIHGFLLDGIVDTRDLVESVAGTGAGDDAVCNLFSATFGVDCEDCPGGGTFCINLVIDQLTLPDAGFELQAITEQDVAQDPTCTE